jgi:sugar-specific transcriptional regulator TrmB
MASDDPLARLEARLDRASEAAERLIAEAAAAAVRRPPPAGWQRVQSEDAEPKVGSALGNELELLLEAVQSLRDRIPPDLQRRLGEALRELLLAIRALIDWYLERNERRRGETDGVEDIPIA